MEIYRKPATAEWYYDSAQKVDTVQSSKEPWTGTLGITFDATKDKDGDRHTTMRICLSEKDVENLYAGLQKGRLAAAKALSIKSRELDKKLGEAVKGIKKHLEQLEEEWLGTEAGSVQEKRIEALKKPLEALLEKNRDWKWRY